MLKGSSNKCQPQTFALVNVIRAYTRIKPSVARGSDQICHSDEGLKSVSDGAERREDPSGERKVRIGRDEVSSEQKSGEKEGMRKTRAEKDEILEKHFLKWCAL